MASQSEIREQVEFFSNLPSSSENSTAGVKVRYIGTKKVELSLGRETEMIWCDDPANAQWAVSEAVKALKNRR